MPGARVTTEFRALALSDEAEPAQRRRKA